MNRWTDEWTEFLPILQDFIPYRGCCPASIKITKKNQQEKTVEQGKGTADHLMPLGDWLYLVLSRAADLKGTMSYRTEGENFHESVRGKGFLRGQGGWNPGALRP